MLGGSCWVFWFSDPFSYGELIVLVLGENQAEN
jgi:hypothetical protein